MGFHRKFKQLVVRKREEWGSIIILKPFYFLLQLIVDIDEWGWENSTFWGKESVMTVLGRGGRAVAGLVLKMRDSLLSE